MFEKKLKNKDIDLLKASKQKDNSKSVRLLKYAIFPLVSVILLGGMYVYFFINNQSLNRNIKKVEEEIAVIEQEQAKDVNLEKYKELQSVLQETEKYKLLYEHMESYPQLSQLVFDQLLLSAGMETDIVSFHYQRETEEIQLQIETSSASETQYFVRKLKNTGAFANVDYTGYLQTSKQVKNEAVEQNDTVEGDSETKNDNDAMAQALLELLEEDKEEEIQEYYVYTASIVCKLK